MVIAGAGIAGLSAGWKLAAGGFGEFEVLELEAAPGGNSRSGENEISAYPWAAHYLPVPTAESTAVRELLDEMGFVIDTGPDGEPIYDPRHLCHAPQERVHVDGEWREGLSARDLVDDPAEAAELEAFERRMREWHAWKDDGGRRSFALPMELSSGDPNLLELDRMSMREYFDLAGWRSEKLRWYVDYCCRDDYGCGLDTTSAWAGWHYFCSRPADVEYLTWPEGNGRIVRHLAERLGERVRTEMLVYRMSLSEDGVDVDALDLRTETAVRFRAERVIYALPRFTAPWVIEGYELEGIDEFTYSPWLVANLTVRRLPDEAAWDNVIYGSRSLGYVVATHQDLRITSGASVLTYYLPLAARDPAAERRTLEERSWSDWVALILADLSGVHPGIERLVNRVDVMLWGHAMIRPVPGFIWGAARRRAAAPFGPVRFAHSDMSGLSLFEEAQYRGVRAAEDVLRELGYDVPSSLET